MMQCRVKTFGDRGDFYAEVVEGKRILFSGPVADSAVLAEVQALELWHKIKEVELRVDLRFFIPEDDDTVWA
jgi:hypothetical protein